MLGRKTSFSYKVCWN